MPQIYVRARTGDIDGSGALLSGDSVDLKLIGDLNNQGGTVAGRTTVALTADNINNLAGRITDKDVAVIAGTDLNNIGGTIDAQNSLAAIAGRDVTDLNTLAQQPGMAWVNQLISDPALVNSTSWKTVEEAHKKWQTDQGGLGPVSSALVMLVVAVATAGAGASAVGSATGMSATSAAAAYPITAAEIVAMGFAFDTTGAATIKAATQANAIIADARIKAEAEKARQQQILENNARKDDAQQYDQYRKIDSTKPEGEWDWKAQAPNGGAVTGTQQNVTLEVGTLLDRFGSEFGTYLSPSGVSYEARGLAPGSKADGYSQYKVVKSFEVEQAVIAPAFGEPGGGIQYRVPTPDGQSIRVNVDYPLRNGHLVK